MIVQEQMVRKLCRADRPLTESILRPEVIRHLRISHQTNKRGMADMGQCDLMI